MALDLVSRIGAINKKGIWIGKSIPIGYDIIDRKLIINESKAEIVKYIYKRYSLKYLTGNCLVLNRQYIFVNRGLL